MSEIQSLDNEENQLPPVLIVSKFTAARSKEIQLMKNALSNASGTKLAFQKLPRHMRRRAMSHNAKRLPRRLREIHLNQMKKSGLLSQQKRPSRKYRRRPYNLMSEYIRRQKIYTWLDTHVWHAKRFHMIHKWGHRLPFSPCDKAFKACYRATIKHCLLQDISYYKCVEIIGDVSIIADNFKKISDPCLGLTVTAKAYLKGCREGSMTIFKLDDNKKAIGTIYFNWKPQVKTKHVLWIWTHAAYYSETLNTLVDCFNLNLNSMELEASNEGTSYTNVDNIELRELNLKRFRLTGPLANAVLQNCFHLPDYYENVTEWSNNYIGDIAEQIKLQKEYWMHIKNIFSTTELPPHLIISLIIEDPRLYLPKKRSKSLQESIPSKSIHLLPDNLAEGPIWSNYVRKVVAENKPPNSTLTEQRRSLLVPGSDLEEKGVSLPIMLIQRPGKKTQENLGYSSGWDIIIPSGWAQPVWISLIMWGARPGGLKQTNFIDFELNQPNILYPDTKAGVEEELSISNQCKEVYFRLPPNKRTNYNKFKIVSPFNWNWSLLLSDWNITGSSVNDFFVLRDLNQLRLIQDIISAKLKYTNKLDYCHNCLIPVSIRFAGKGICKRFAIICLPIKDDLKKIPVEEKCLDENEKARKELRKKHKILLKRTRRRRIRDKKIGKITPIDTVMLKNYKSKIRELWLPQATTIRYSCSREVIGFVKDGDFSFLLGQSKAIGYIAMSAIPTLISLGSRGKILVRNTNSKHYCLGKLEVITQ